MPTISASPKPVVRFPEIAASDLQAARDFLLDGATPVASPGFSPAPARERSRRPSQAAGAGRTVVRHGISLARIRSSAKSGQ